MKLHHRNSTRGGVLVTTLIICVLIGVMLAAYLSMVSNQHKFSQRSQVWNNCIPMCEAGVEEALAHLNHINTTSNFAVNGWTSNSGAFYKTRTLNGGIARMAISNDSPPTITVIASLQAPVQEGSITRRIRVKTKLNQKFPNGILSKGGVTLGGGSRVDSFNSALPGIESDANGQYTLATATARATVVSTAQGVGAINVGNMSIFGNVATGPGGTVSVGPNGNVGDTVWNNDPTYDGDIQPGHITDDVNVYIADSSFPSQFGPVQGWPGPGIVGTTLYDHVFGDGDYRLIGNFSLTLLQKAIVTGKTRIHITGQTLVSGSASITLTTNATVEWYAGLNVDIKGGGVVNVGGLAKNFSVIGLNNCLSVSYSGTSKFIGTVYAPNAAVSISGTADAFGALVGKTISLSGTMSFHYDEALKGDPKKSRFIAASWQEL